MTLLVTMFGQDDGPLLASDGRVMFNTPEGANIVDDDATKIHRITDHCAIAIAGADLIGGYFLDQLNASIRKGVVRDDAEAISDHLHKLLAEFYGSRLSEPSGLPLLQFIIAGYRNNKKHTDPAVYLLDNGARFDPQVKLAGIGIAGWSPLAMFFGNWLYRPDLRLPQRIALAAFFIHETARIDAAVGGTIRMCHIKPEGLRMIRDDEITEAVAQNEKVRVELARLFFAGRDGR